MSNFLIDLRNSKNEIWNLELLYSTFPEIRNLKCRNNKECDYFVYKGYQLYGEQFLCSIKGRFAVVFYDNKREQLFLARDWIGEQPFHLLATSKYFYVANLISHIQKEERRKHLDSETCEFFYSYIRSFPQAHYQIISFKDVDPNCLVHTISPNKKHIYFDFISYTQDINFDGSNNYYNQIKKNLFNSIKSRATKSKRCAVLLSGGLDSFSIALSMKIQNIPFEAYTLSIDDGSEDVEKAIEYARYLDVKHNIINVKSYEVKNAFDKAIENGECYHLFNVYCTVGMSLIAEKAPKGITYFCGEGVNEAVGDYHNWIVYDPSKSKKVILQKVDYCRLAKTETRCLYVWGHPEDKGKYNRQLGTGLAKHASGRMTKPFISNELTLECPYFDKKTIGMIIKVPADALDSMGGKPGLFIKAFSEELKTLGIKESLLRDCKKVRLQDASEHGTGGITSILFQEGFDQKYAIDRFNDHFWASIDPIIDGRRLAWMLDLGE